MGGHARGVGSSGNKRKRLKSAEPTPLDIPRQERLKSRATGKVRFELRGGQSVGREALKAGAGRVPVGSD